MSSTSSCFARQVQHRLHLLDPLRYKLIEIPFRLHHPMWLENCRIDFDYHIRRVQVDLRPAARRELDQVIGENRQHPTGPQPPAVGTSTSPRGWPTNRFALIGKVHHALADGVASANLLARLIDLTGSRRRMSGDSYAACTDTLRRGVAAVGGP